MDPIKIKQEHLTLRQGMPRSVAATLRRTDPNDAAFWVTKPAAAKALGVTEVSVWRHVRDGKLSCYRGPVYGSRRATRIWYDDVASLRAIQSEARR